MGPVGHTHADDNTMRPAGANDTCKAVHLAFEALLGLHMIISPRGHSSAADKCMGMRQGTLPRTRLRVRQPPMVYRQAALRREEAIYQIRSVAARPGGLYGTLAAMRQMLGCRRIAGDLPGGSSWMLLVAVLTMGRMGAARSVRQHLA